MKRVACLKCGSTRLHRSRHKWWMERVAAIAGWRAQRCRDCNQRFLQCGERLTPAAQLKHLRKRIVLGAAALAAVAVVLAAILYLSHAQSTPPLDGMFLPL